MTEKYKKDTLKDFYELEDWWGNYLKELHRKQEQYKKAHEEKQNGGNQEAKK